LALLTRYAAACARELPARPACIDLCSGWSLRADVRPFTWRPSTAVSRRIWPMILVMPIVPFVATYVPRFALFLAG
jgi:hypothetical protein